MKQKRWLQGRRGSRLRMAKKAGDVAEQPAKKAKMIEEDAELMDVKLTQ